MFQSTFDLIAKTISNVHVAIPVSDDIFNWKLENWSHLHSSGKIVYYSFYEIQYHFTVYIDHWNQWAMRQTFDAIYCYRNNGRF